MSEPPLLILASASPRRRQLLERVGIPTRVVPADIDETPHDGEAAVSYALRLACDKARTVLALHPDSSVLAADTVVEVNDAILGKPVSGEHARQLLGRLLGTEHRVTTAFAVRGSGIDHEQAVTTDVVMRSARPSELDDYIACGEWQGKAGGYAVQGIAAAFVCSVRGSITNVIGLPLAEVLAALAAAGVHPNYRKGMPV